MVSLSPPSPPHPLLPFLLLPFLAFAFTFTFTTTTTQAAHLPAIRTPQFAPAALVPARTTARARARARTRTSTSARSLPPTRRAQLPAPLRLPPGHPAASAIVPARSDARRLASRLLRTAASHKDHSLRDVLNSAPHTTPRSPTVSPHSHDSSERPPSSADLLAGLAAKLYPSNGNFSGSSSERHLAMTIERDANEPLHIDTPQIPPRVQSSSPKSVATAAETAALSHALDNLRAAQRVQSPTRAASALRTLQELCHSLQLGAALQAADGLSHVIVGLSDPIRPVRAAAAWALATCAQNNPTVQRAALTHGALSQLAHLALTDDAPPVRGRALFALNALLGCEEARKVFERMDCAPEVLAKGLRDGRDFRATRRALNLAELLVRRDANRWRGVLESWRVPPLVEHLMREHPDIDVRESAARFIAALEGPVLA